MMFRCRAQAAWPLGQSAKGLERGSHVGDGPAIGPTRKEQGNGKHKRRLRLLRRTRGQAAQLPVVRNGDRHCRRSDGPASGRRENER